MPKTQKQVFLETIERLENEKAEHLTLIANYEREQQLSVSAFKNQEAIINSQESLLQTKDDQISELNRKIAQRALRISELFKEKQELRKLLKKNNILMPEPLETANIGTQTEPVEDKELELLEKRLASIKDFTTYQTKLTDKDQIITDLQTQIKNLLVQKDTNKKRALILGIIALINSLLLLFK